MPDNDKHRKRIKHIDLPGHLHELTFSCYQRLALLTNDSWRKLLSRNIDTACEQNHYKLFAFVYMPEHVHLIVQPEVGGGETADFLKAFKRPFSAEIKQLLQANKSSLLQRLTVHQRPGLKAFRFWQEGPGYDRNLVEPSTILSSVDYIHLNPVKRGLCFRAVEWKWSSARWFANPNDVDPDLPKLTSMPAEWFVGLQ